MKFNLLLLSLLAYLGGFAQSSVAIDSIDNLISKSQNDSVKVMLHLSASDIIANTDDSTSILRIEKALKIAINTESKFLKGYCYEYYGNHYYYRTNFAEAIENYLVAEAFYEEVGELYRKSNVINQLGIIYDRTGDHFSALTKFYATQELNYQIQDSSRISSVFNNIGTVYFELGKYDLARDYYKRSIAIDSVLSRKIALAYTYNNLGEIAAISEDNKEALDYFRFSTQILESLGHVEALGLNYTNIAGVLTEQMRYDSARYYIEKANRIQTDLKDNYGLLNTAIFEMNLLNGEGKFSESIALGAACVENARKRNLANLEKTALKYLYESYNGLNDYETALTYHVAYTSLKDSIYNGVDAFSLAEIESQFDIEEKLIEINSLKTENQSLSNSFWKQDWFLITVFFVLLIILLFFLERGRKKDSDKNQLRYENINYLRSTPALYIIAATLHAFLPQLLPIVRGNIYDPVWIRYSISGVIMVIYFLSFAFQVIRKNIDRFAKILYLVLLVHTLFLLHINHLELEHTFYLIIILIGSVAVFKTVISLSVFTVSIAIATVAVAFTSGAESIDPFLFSTIIISILIVLLVIGISKTDLDKYLEFSNEVLNQADALVFIVDRKGNNIYTSPSIRNILGIDPKSLFTHNWLEKLGIERSAAYKIKNNLILIAMGSIDASSDNYQIMKKANGEPIWLSIKEKRLKNDQVLVIGVDVSEQKQVQDNLAESEMRFRQINGTVSDVFFLYNINHNKYEYISPNTALVLGPPPEFFYNGKDYLEDFILDIDRDKVKRSFMQAFNGFPSEVEYRIVIAGQIHWVREKTFPVLSNEGEEEVVKVSGICQDITQRKAAEEEIKKLSLIASHTDNFILIVDKYNRVEWANLPFYKLTGYDEHETIGKLPLELISGKNTSEETIDLISDAVFAQKQQLQCEMITYKRDDSWFNASLEVTPIISETGELEKYFVIGTDISEQVKDKEQIEKLSLVASNTANYVIIVNTETGIEWVNQAFTDMFSYTLDEVQGKFPSNVLHNKEHSIQDVELINDTVFNKQLKYNGELEHSTKFNETVHVRVDITPLQVKDGRVEKYFVLGVDITERKKFEEDIKRANLELSAKETELLESESNLRELIRSIKEVFWLRDLKTGKYTFISDSYEYVFGTTIQSLIDDPSSWSKQIHPNDKGRVLAAFKNANGAKGFNEDFRLIMDNGSIKWLNSRVFPIHNEAGELVKLSGFTEDITASKEAELAIKKIADQLDVVHNVEKTILNAKTTDEIIYNTLETALLKLPILRASLALFNEVDGTFYAYAKNHTQLNSVMDKKEYDLSDFKLYDVIKDTREHQLSNLVEKKNPSATDLLLIDEGAEIVLLSPLLTGDEVIGTFNVCFKEDFIIDIDHFTEITGEIANGLALGIFQSQLKDELRQSNNAITSSIDYAKMIQQAYIPSSLNVGEHFMDHAIINKPKDIVSGDFYWTGSVGDTKIVAVGDCTGHGVPGAFMTLIGINELNNIVNQKQIVDPATILNMLNDAIISALLSTNEVQLRDGMDIGIFAYNANSDKVCYAGARRPLYQVNANGVLRHEGVKLSIGDLGDDFGIAFKTMEIPFEKNDHWFIFSDGCPDQFGGEKTRKFSRKRLEVLFDEVKTESVEEQVRTIDKALADWQGNVYQTDDMLLVGFKI